MKRLLPSEPDDGLRRHRTVFYTVSCYGFAVPAVVRVQVERGAAIWRQSLYSARSPPLAPASHVSRYAHNQTRTRVTVALIFFLGLILAHGRGNYHRPYRSAACPSLVIIRGIFSDPLSSYGRSSMSSITDTRAHTHSPCRSNFYSLIAGCNFALELFSRYR